MKNKKKIILIILVVLLFIMSVTILVLKQTGVINKIIEVNKQEEIKKEITCQVYKHIDGKVAILVVAEDTENGIEKLIYPDNEMEIYCNGRTKAAYDYNADITGKESITFKAVNTIGEEIEKTLLLNDEFYDGLVEYKLINETESQRVLTVNYKAGSTVKQYRIGDSSAWVNYGGGVRIDDYQILETLGNEITETNLGLRQVDNVGNEIISKVKLSLATYKQEDAVIEGESIIDCIENNELESGNYIFRVTYNDEGNKMDYPVELYNYNEDANYITNNRAVIAGRTYTGMGKISSEKRMLILKYNGNLTINSGVTITPTGTNASINGETYLCTKKGMFIYCAGTLTNNGTITMTAKGTVNQAGENVYLYKNEDNTYEYIPAVGGAGANSVTGRSIGKTGNTGTNRKTGGGGSGAALSSGSKSISGAGSAGTSYSGGTGGSGKWHSSGTINGGSGSPNGGAGGSGTWDGYVGFSSGGGAGNPGGKRSLTSGGYNIEGGSGGTGTGGLLVINANAIVNNSTIVSNGASGGYGRAVGGGGSGGGSINLFYKDNIIKGTIIANGGAAGPCGSRHNEEHYRGGYGGTGSITVGNISTGTFVKD